MRTLGIYMSLEGYVSNSKHFGLLCYLNVIFWGKHVFEKIWLFFSGGYIYGYPCYYEVMFWVHMFVEGHYFMKLCFRGLFLENFDFLSLCFSKSMFPVSSCLNIYVFLEGYLHVCHLPKGNLYDCIRFQISLWISFEFVPLPFGFPPECQLAFCHFVGGLVNSKIWIPLGENSKCILATVHYTNQKV